jgi:4-hydroxy-tetrahydrodipicolinate reductase
MNPIKVILTGGCGQMGKQFIKTFYDEHDIEITGVIDKNFTGVDAGTVAGIPEIGITITDSLEEILKKSEDEIIVDFTCHEAACKHIEIALSRGLSIVSGTTGFSDLELQHFNREAEKKSVPLFIAPNFAIGAVLMMKFAATASRYFSSAEIIELHHNRKKDAPSGTSMLTAREMLRNFSPAPPLVTEKELLPSVRGADMNGIRIHSVRLPGFVAHQEVLFGGSGEVLTIRHDSMSRESFMPGVVLAVKKVKTLQPGLTFGLDKLLDL